ncbi:MAG: sterol desaturase family protein [Marinomonas sp.]|jgi:sterol desaturase/sphingolipid hydroxylase (fatty acid hydroxylase superfamily)
MEVFWNEYWQTLFGDLISPQKRVSLAYLVSAFIIAILCLTLFSKLSIKNALRHVFQAKVWLSATAFADYKTLVINAFVLKLISPFLLAKMLVAIWLFEQWHWLMPDKPEPNIWPTWLVVLCFTIFQFVLDDFCRFYLHRLMHKWQFLWAFHQVHHSATELNPFTVFRTHPVESVLFSLRSTLSQGFSIALFFYLFPNQVDIYMVLGVNVVIFAFNLLGANLRHSNVMLCYPHWLEKVLISPAQHQIHHSVAREHWDKNFGVVLACWDKWFKSLHHSDPTQTLKFGLGSDAGKNHNSLLALYLLPFLQSARFLCIEPCQLVVKKLKAVLEKRRV